MSEGMSEEGRDRQFASSPNEKLSEGGEIAKGKVRDKTEKETERERERTMGNEIEYE